MQQQNKPLVGVNLLSSDEDVFTDADLDVDSPNPSDSSLSSKYPRKESIENVPVSDRMQRAIEKPHRLACAEAKLEGNNSLYRVKQEHRRQIYNLLQKCDSDLARLKRQCIEDTKDLRQVLHPELGVSRLQSLPAELRQMILEACLPCPFDFDVGGPRDHNVMGDLRRRYSSAAFPIASVCHSLMLDLIFLLQTYH